MDGGRCLSSERIRQRICNLIEAESGDAVLSNDQLVFRLKTDGAIIAHRTVGKYR